MHVQERVVTVHVYATKLIAYCDTTGSIVRWPHNFDSCPIVIELVDDGMGGLALGWGPYAGRTSFKKDATLIRVHSFSPIPANLENRRRTEEILDNVGAIDLATGKAYDSNFIWREFLVCVSTWLMKSFTSVCWCLYYDFPLNGQGLFSVVAEEAGFRDSTTMLAKDIEETMVCGQSCTKNLGPTSFDSVRLRLSNMSGSGNIKEGNDDSIQIDAALQQMDFARCAHQEAPVSSVHDYFNICYHRRLRRYVIKGRTTQHPSWYTLPSVRTCLVRGRQLCIGDCVEVRLHSGKNTYDQNWAKVKGIRVLEETCWLLCIAWFYYVDHAWHESNHLQILEWDTVNYCMESGHLRSQTLFDACVTRSVLDCPKRIEFWSQKQKALMECR